MKVIMAEHMRSGDTWVQDNGNEWKVIKGAKPCPSYLAPAAVEVLLGTDRSTLRTFFRDDEKVAVKRSDNG